MRRPLNALPQAHAVPIHGEPAHRGSIDQSRALLVVLAQTKERHMTNPSTNLAQQIRLHRSRHRWSQTDLLREVGWSRSPSTISLIESGRQAVTVDQLFDFAKAFDVDISALLEQPATPPPPSRPGISQPSDQELAEFVRDYISATEQHERKYIEAIVGPMSRRSTIYNRLNRAEALGLLWREEFIVGKKGLRASKMTDKCRLILEGP